MKTKEEKIYYDINASILAFGEEERVHIRSSGKNIILFKIANKYLTNLHQSHYPRNPSKDP